MLTHVSRPVHNNIRFIIEGDTHLGRNTQYAPSLPTQVQTGRDPHYGIVSPKGQQRSIPFGGVSQDLRVTPGPKSVLVLKPQAAGKDLREVNTHACPHARAHTHTLHPSPCPSLLGDSTPFPSEPPARAEPLPAECTAIFGFSFSCHSPERGTVLGPERGNAAKQSQR